MTPPLVYDRHLEAPRDLVWGAWTRSAALGEWLALEARAEPAPGGPFELFWNLDDRRTDSTVGCTFLEVDRGVAFKAEWRGPAKHPVMGRETWIEVHLDVGPDDTTYLTLVHGGWGRSDDWADARRWQHGAWRHALDSLGVHLRGGARPRQYTVILHKPGPQWQSGVDFRQQPGVTDHIAHMAELHADGRMLMGGPFLVEDAGGMVVFEGDVDAARDWCDRDPAVSTGLLEVELRPWLVPMRR